MRFLGTVFKSSADGTSERYSHLIDLDTDATCVEDPEGNVVYVVHSDCQVYDAMGDRLGSFRTVGKHWGYYPTVGPWIPTEHTDLLKAERLVFQILLETK